MKETDSHRLLNKFVGKWITEGKMIATDSTPQITISGTDTYEWLPGNHFLMHKVDVCIGQDKIENLEIIGLDKATGNIIMRYYDNKGNTGVMTADVIDGNWTFTGESLRFKGGFSEDENIFSGTWEQLSGDDQWNRFIEIKLTRSLDTEY